MSRRSTLNRVALDVGQLQHGDDVIPRSNNFLKRLQAKGVLRHPGKEGQINRGANVENEMIVVDPEFFPVECAGEENLPAFEIDPFDLAISKLRARENCPQRIEDISRLNFSREQFRHEAVEANEIVPIDDRQPELLSANRSRKFLVEQDLAKPPPNETT